MALWRKPLQRNAGKSITDESGRAGSRENDLCQKKNPLQNTTCASRFTAQVISAPQCDIISSCVDSNVANIHILTYNLMETVEAKLEVNVAKSVDTTFSQETGDRFVSPAPLFKRCLAFLKKKNPA